MKAPFTLPVSFNEHWDTISDAKGQTVADHESGNVTPEAIAFVIYAINNVNRFADAIVELQAATDAEMDARPGKLPEYCAARDRLMAARVVITELAKEISDDH